MTRKSAVDAMMGDSATPILDELDQTIIELAVAGRTTPEIAKATGLSRQSVWNKLRKPKFRELIARLCQETFEARIRSILTKWDKMEGTFEAIIDDKESAAFAKIAAATQLKSIMITGQEMAINQRVTALTDRIHEIEKHLIGTPGSVIAVDPDDDEEDEGDGVQPLENSE